MSHPEAGAAARDEIWQPFLSSLPAAARILEIVPASARSTLEPLAPDAAVTSVEIVAGWDEALPPVSFEACAGEFVVTEANAQDLLSRLQRVLAPGAELQFILHHPESYPLAHAIATSVEADYLFGRNHVFAALSRLLSLPANAPADSVQAAGQALHQAIAQLRQAVESGQSQGHGDFLHTALNAVGSLLNAWRAQPGPAVVAEVAEAERQLRGYAQRMQSTVAVDADAMERIAASARELGYTRVEFEPAMRDEALFGWQLLLHRP